MDSDQCITKLKRILSYYKFEFHYSKEIQSEPQFEATIRYFKEKVNLQLYHYDHNVCYGYYIIQILKTAYCFADIFQTDTKGFDHHLNIFLDIIAENIRNHPRINYRLLSIEEFCCESINRINNFDALLNDLAHRLSSATNVPQTISEIAYIYSDVLPYRKFETIKSLLKALEEFKIISSINLDSFKDIVLPAIDRLDIVPVIEEFKKRLIKL